MEANVPEHAKAINDSMKIIVTLCDPIHRMVSDFVHTTETNEPHAKDRDRDREKILNAHERGVRFCLSQAGEWLGLCEDLTICLFFRTEKLLAINLNLIEKKLNCPGFLKF